MDGLSIRKDYSNSLHKNELRTTLEQSIQLQMELLTSISPVEGFSIPQTLSWDC